MTAARSFSFKISFQMFLLFTWSYFFNSLFSLTFSFQLNYKTIQLIREERESPCACGTRNRHRKSWGRRRRNQANFDPRRGSDGIECPACHAASPTPPSWRCAPSASGWGWWWREPAARGRCLVPPTSASRRWSVLQSEHRKRHGPTPDWQPAMNEVQKTGKIWVKNERQLSLRFLGSKRAS